MGINYYLNLIKKESDIETVKLRYFINIFISVINFVLLFAGFSLRSENTMLSGVCGMSAMLTMVLSYVLEFRFQRLLKDIIADDSLDPDDSVDAAFIAYRKGYIESISQNAAIEKIYLIIRIIIAAIFVAGFQVSIVLGIVGDSQTADMILRVLTLMMLGFIVVVFGFAFVSGLKSGVWFQNYIKELEIIKEFKAQQSGASGKTQKRKYKFLEDKKPQEQMKYLFCDDGLYHKICRLQKIGSIGGLVLGIMLGLSIVLLDSIMKGAGLSTSDAELWSGIILLAMLGATIAFCGWQGAASKRTIAEQFKRLNPNNEQDALRIQLHGLRAPFFRRWVIIILLVFIGAIVLNIALAGMTAYLAKTDAYGWIFFVLFIIKIIVLFKIYFAAFGNFRFKMMAIEKQIDAAVSPKD